MRPRQARNTGRGETTQPKILARSHQAPLRPYPPFISVPSLLPLNSDLKKSRYSRSFLVVWQLEVRCRHCRSVGLIPGPGISARCGQGQKRKKERNQGILNWVLHSKGCD